MDSRSINRAKVDVNKYSSNTKRNEIKTRKSDLLSRKVIIIKNDDKNNAIKNENNSEIVKVNKNERNHFIYISKPEYHKEIKKKIEDKVISLRNRLEYKNNCQYKEIKEFKRIETDSKINKKDHNTSYQIKTHSFRNNDKSGITLKEEEKTKTIINSKNNQEVRSQERGNKNEENKEKSSSFSTRTIASDSNEGRRQIPISNISNTHIHIQNTSNESDKNKKSNCQIKKESKFIINKGNKRDIFEDNNVIKKLNDIKPKISETKEIKITDSIKEHEDILRNVKSNYVFKSIFSFIEEKRKLIILKYNKFYHKQLNKTIDDYKNISGRYKKDGINGSGTEYLLDKKILVFKGEYLNGKRNGYGREFENYKMIFEGEYINGKRNGEGKEYIDRNLVFQGEYLNGKRNGEGKEYIDGNLVFKGNYLDGKRNGYGREYKYNKLLFEGNYLNGKKNGNAKKYYDNGKLKFEGNYLNGKKWNGKIYGKNCKDVSELKDGKGTIKKYDGTGNLKFEGEYLNGEKNGKGKEYEFNEVLFEGEYLNGKKNGKGKEYEFNEVLFEGEYLNGKRWNGNKIIYNWDLINDCKMHGYSGRPMCFYYYIKYLDGKEQLSK